jgi:hypothetical protein
MAVVPPDAVNCTSEDTIENSVASPATTHAVVGKRVFTGKVPVILIMAILPRVITPFAKRP